LPFFIRIALVGNRQRFAYDLPAPGIIRLAWRSRYAQRSREATMRILMLTAVAAVVAACTTMTTQGPAAVATLEPTKGSTAGGKVTFTQKGSKVVVLANVSGLSPGQHGFHVHEKGDCSSGDGMSAGGHFNPFGKPHGDPAAADHHAGDMPMLVADGAGNATLTVELELMTIGDGAGDIIGKAVIVHKDPDDFKTQPTGNSGARVACGVIRKA
jgi:Cu-Zn family superoxide dismutase